MLDRPKFSLHRWHSTGDVPPQEHRRLKRLVGVALMSGVVLVVIGPTC